MNVTTERHSLFRLWLESFAVVNRSVGKLLGLVLVSILVVGLLMWGILASLGGIVGLAAKVQQASTVSKSGLIGAFGMYLVAVFGMHLYSVFGWIVASRMIAAEGEQKQYPFFEYFSGSIIPTLWQILLGLLVGILLGIGITIIALPCVFIFHTIIPVYIALGVLFLTLGIRLIYTSWAIAIKDKGPIESLKYSWELTRGEYVDTLLMVILSILTGVGIRFVIKGIIYGVKVVIPLYFADSFSLTSPVWWVFGIILVLICVLLYIIPMAFPILVFLNRAADMDPRSRVTGESFPTVPLPAVEIPNLHPSSVAQAHVEEGLPPTTDRVAVQQAAQQAAQAQVPQPQEQDPAEITGMMPLGSVAPKPAPQPAPKPQPAVSDKDNLQLSQSSVNTSDETADEIDQHLNKVYTPSKENIVQYGDEDRMPTILFDDEMAKQLEESAKQFAPNKKKSEGPEDPGSIKISK